jgi:hypothetical protein
LNSKISGHRNEGFPFCSRRILKSVVQLISLLFSPYYFTVFFFFVKGNVSRLAESRTAFAFFAGAVFEGTEMEQ